MLHINPPCLVVICAPPAVMNSMFPNWSTPDRSLNMSLISSSVNWSTFSASCSGKCRGKNQTGANDEGDRGAATLTMTLLNSSLSFRLLSFRQPDWLR